MLDFILFVAVAGVFYGGFWCGKTFGTVGAMFTKARESVKTWI